jgi:chromosomal replication initiator protein
MIKKNTQSVGVARNTLLKKLRTHTCTCPQRPKSAFNMGLNPDWTFEEFVSGPSNSMALAAADAVSRQPGSFTPLLICGPQRIGKSHLMQAIGHRVLQTTKHTVSFVTWEALFTEYIESLQARNVTEFRNKYHSVDVLLVDNIHILPHTKRFQNEMVCTFNALYKAHKQIVMTSDIPTREHFWIADKLVSRFEKGLVICMGPDRFHCATSERSHHEAICRLPASEPGATPRTPDTP